MRFFSLLLLLPFLLGAAPRGREIYLEGTGEVTAVIAGGTEVPASALPCGSCHGRDGRGQAEGGVKPSDLTRIDDDRALKRGIAMGLGSDGRQLHVAMPRYRMSQQDMADLISYIKTLGHQTDPGVSDKTVRIGTVLPPSLSKPVQEALAARFEKAGELWGRRIELKTLELTSPSQVRDFLEKEEVFAVVGAFLAGADAELAKVFEEAEVPLVGPFSLHPGENRYVFHLSPGLEDQMKALKRFATEKKLDSPVFFPGTGPEALALLRKAEAEGNRPTLLATGRAADTALLSAPPGFDGRIFVAVPNPSSRNHSSTQLAALAAAEVLLEGLERAGRTLTRDRLIGSLESLRSFQTGYGPPVTFGPVRRLGARGAYILKADLKRKVWVPEGGWVEAE
ncbi:MAG TPA: ABC transporter substrate-binding protein [Thermoanaerobaculia bacterium]|nr:ABC transporter substrate-binding protein [Thermoanaerobaculia bacterium]